MDGKSNTLLIHVWEKKLHLFTPQPHYIKQLENKQLHILEN